MAYELRWTPMWRLLHDWTAMTRACLRQLRFVPAVALVLLVQGCATTDAIRRATTRPAIAEDRIDKLSSVYKTSNGSILIGFTGSLVGGVGTNEYTIRVPSEILQEWKQGKLNAVVSFAWNRAVSNAGDEPKDEFESTSRSRIRSVNSLSSSKATVSPTPTR
jgi:hypothetical protein